MGLGISSIGNYAVRIAKVFPDAVFGTGSDIAGKAIRAQKGSIWSKGKAGFKAVEDLSKSGSFWTRATKNLGRIKTCTLAGIRAGGKKGFFGKIAGGAKGLFKGLGKNMPFLAAASTLLFELPNIWKATKEQGIGQGLAEIGKTTARLGAGAACAAIGSAICPGIGSLVGWIAGDWIASKIVGDSYSVQKAEAEEKAKQTAQVQGQSGQIPFQGGMNTNPIANNNPYNYGMTNPMEDYSNPYANDIMMQGMKFNTVG